jgi:hypothetical protein
VHGSTTRFIASEQDTPGAASYAIDGRATAFSFTSTDVTALQFVMPALSPETHTLVVSTPWGPSAPYMFSVAPPPSTTTTASTTVAAG